MPHMLGKLMRRHVHRFKEGKDPRFESKVIAPHS